ncbi:ribonuclease P protein component [Kaistella rhinocerotis]|uniref:ribonuclease P protein component n=1 Tax=Kaistella rhinocerotis TaxID=3026437 RepID=UPI002553CDD5|nr:ribonuclease P protein component [Kaistella sp. Ran72]
MDYKYSAHQKLKQKRQIDLLFTKGKWTSCGNLRVISLDLDRKPQEGSELLGPKTGVSVSKKLFKEAIHRNRVKRLLREAYRHHKPAFAARFGENTLAMIFWISKEMPADFNAVQEDFLMLCKPKN